MSWRKRRGKSRKAKKSLTQVRKPEGYLGLLLFLGGDARPLGRGLFLCLRTIWLKHFWTKQPNKRQIAIFLSIVQPIPHHKLIGQIKPNILKR